MLPDLLLEGLLQIKGNYCIEDPFCFVEEGEDIFGGAIREVKEETRINTKFLKVLAFSTQHTLVANRKTWQVG